MKVYQSLSDAIRGAVGEHGGEDLRFKVAAAICAGRVIAEGIAQVPLKIMLKDGDMRRDATDHPLYDLLAWQPNEFQTSFEFREVLTLHAVFGGNAYAYINRVDGEIVELIPLVPDRVAVRQNEKYQVVYELSDHEHNLIGTYAPDQIFHLRGPSWTGYEGINILRVAGAVLGLSYQLERAQLKTHQKSRRPDGILRFDGKLTDEQRALLKKSWDTAFGPDGEGGIAILENLFDFKEVNQSATESQTLQNREFQINEVARLMRVWPQMLMQDGKTSSYASSSQFFLAHVTHTLLPWAARWEQVIKRDLIGRGQPEYAKFVFEALLRGTPQERADFYQAGITNSWLTPNEARAKEDLNPLPGLDQPLMPLNMAGPHNPDAPGR